MKNIRSLAVSLTLLAPLAVFGQTHSGTSHGQTGSSTNQRTSSSGQLQQVSKDSLDSQVTAKNLLGKEVYDQSGKKIGSIEDVMLAGHAPSLVAAQPKRHPRAHQRW
jgi:hypothetical protein